MGFLIFILVIIFFIYLLPRIMMSLFPYLLKRRIRKMYGQTNRRAAGNSGDGGAREPAAPRQPRKKIDDSVGEYVHFEEIDVKVEETVQTDADGDTRTEVTVETEEQIVDVEWEDLTPAPDNTSEKQR